MNPNTSVAIVLSMLFLSIGGCLYGTQREGELTQREKEKTKQVTIQARIDSLKIVTNNNNE